MEIFNALAEPTRREIIEMLAIRGRLSAAEICENFNASPQAISQHLKVLREAKLVKVEKKAQQRIYELDPDVINELGLWTNKMTSLWNERHNALDRLLEVEKKKLINHITPGGEGELKL
jgi:DNA-binding transcriptional ArsR family regulator